MNEYLHGHEEVNMNKKGSRVVFRMLTIYADQQRTSRLFRMVVPFSISGYKMGISKALSSTLEITPRFCHTIHSQHHFWWHFQPLSIRENPSTHFSCSRTAGSPMGSVFDPGDLFICTISAQLCHRSSYNKRKEINQNFITDPSLLPPSLLSATYLNSLYQPMGDLNMLPTTTSTSNTPKTRSNTNTSFYCQDGPRILQNPGIFGMVSAQNNQQAYNYPEASFIPLTHLHPTSYYQQPYNLNLEFPSVVIPEHQTPLAFPACPIEAEGSGMGASVYLTPRGFLNEDTSNGQFGDAVQGACSLQPLELSEFGDAVQGACSLQPLDLSEIHEQRTLNASISKAARAKRMMARQMSANLHINSSRGCSSTGSPSSSTGVSRKSAKRSTREKGSTDNQDDLYTFCTPDNMKLRVLLQKELSSCDVGTHKRIILPKRDAEKCLPNLSSKEGITVLIRDVYSKYAWQMRYRFWANHKGKIYVLDQFGDFVIHNKLETGDHLTLYEDKNKNLYFSITKTQKTTVTPSDKQYNANQTYNRTSFSEEITDEENTSLRILVEELRHTEHHEVNNLMMLD